MRKKVRNALSRHGFAFLEEFEPGKTTALAAGQLGVPVQLDGFKLVQELRPCHRENSTPNTYSGNYGLTEFPIHTDLAHWPIPPRYFVLRCVEGASSVATRLLDGENVISAVGTVSLRRILVQARRPLEGGRPLMRILEERNLSIQILRWDELYLRPATPASTTAYLDVSQYLKTASVTEVVLQRPGDTLLIDNWRMLHGRSAVNDPGVRRHVERSYMGDLL